MPTVVGFKPPDLMLHRYLVSTEDTEAKPCVYFESSPNVRDAKFMAMTWAVCGWPCRVIDLCLNVRVRPGTMDGEPVLLHYFPDIQSVMSLVPGVKQRPMKIPMMPPCGLAEDEFHTWLLEFSHGKPVEK